MKRKITFIAFLICYVITGFSQDLPEPYTAKAYWNELNNEQYRRYMQMKIDGDTISFGEQQWLKSYKNYLDIYWKDMTSEEKQNFKNQKNSWYSQAGMAELEPVKDSKNTRDTDMFFQYIALSGVSGVSYGIMLNNIFDFKEQSVKTGLPLLIAGGSIMYPLFSKQYDNINNNSLFLKAHGRTAGAFYGYCLANLVYGDKIENTEIYDTNGMYVETTDGKSKQAYAFTLLSSLAMGQLGFYLGKHKDWDEGRVTHYQYYGYLFPALAATGLIASETENYRIVGATFIASGALGYLAADKISQITDYSRGDIDAMYGLTAIGVGYGLGVLLATGHEKPSSILIPAAGGVVGSLAGHYFLNNFELSRQQGRRVNYALFGGAFIGMGLTFIINPDEDAYYGLIPATTGLIGYGIMLNYYRNHPSNFSSQLNKKLPGYKFSFYPENLILSKYNKSGYIPPLASLHMNF